MAWYDRDSLLTWSLGPYGGSIVATILLALLLPILFHYFLYQKSKSTSLPSFLVCGPSSAGKTSIVTAVEGIARSKTHTSLDPYTVEVSLPVYTTAGSSQYRSSHDAIASVPARILVTDTPGHSKLRSHVYSALRTNQYTGIIFVVDAAKLSADKREDETINGLNDAASYLYEILLVLQQQYAASFAKSSKTKDIRVLIAVNKMDLFTALPVVLVQSSLEADISRERDSRGKAQAFDANTDEETPVLGDERHKFSFKSLSNFGLDISLLGGNVAVAEEEACLTEWWQWIAALV